MLMEHSIGWQGHANNLRGLILDGKYSGCLGTRSTLNGLSTPENN
jgi:hypothetical protein